MQSKLKILKYIYFCVNRFLKFEVLSNFNYINCLFEIFGKTDLTLPTRHDADVGKVTKVVPCVSERVYLWVA